MTFMATLENSSLSPRSGPGGAITLRQTEPMTTSISVCVLLGKSYCGCESFAAYTLVLFWFDAEVELSLARIKPNFYFVKGT